MEDVAVMPMPLADRLMNRRAVLKGAAFGGVAACTLTGTALLEGCSASSWITIALNDLPTVLEIALSIINIVGAATGAVTSAVATQAKNAAAAVQQALQTAQSLIQQYQSAGSTTLLGQIGAALNAANSNLTAIMSAFQAAGLAIPQALQVTIAAAIGSAISIVTYLQSLVPTPTVTAAAKLKAASTSNAPYIKSAYNQAVTAAGGSQYVVA